jgi:p-hydroxybenzoate 3-monooxygenase
MDLLTEAGVGSRMRDEGALHHGFEIAFGGRRHRIDLTELSGKAITVYPQHEVIKDLVAARIAADGQLLFEVGDVTLHDIDTATPSVRFMHAGERLAINVDFIVGCDGFHGISASISLPLENRIDVPTTRIGFAQGRDDVRSSACSVTGLRLSGTGVYRPDRPAVGSRGRA